MSTAHEMDAGEAAFALCELEWMRTRVLVQLSCVELSAFADEMSDGVAEASPVLVERVRAAVEEVEALVMSFGQRLASLPARGVLATGDEVAAAAAAALEEGIVDGERALHAAQWIDVGAGLEALARSLSASDAYRFWGIRVERFIAAFRGANRQLARSIANDAEVVDLQFAELSDRQLVRLVAALQRAGGRRG
jgi:hypothetical protein